MIRTVEKPNIALVDTHLKQVRTSVLAAKKGENSGTDAASSAEQKDSPRIAKQFSQASGGKKVTRIRNTSKEEAEIDRLVYQLYGLSEDEIKIVEGR